MRRALRLCAAACLACAVPAAADDDVAAPPIGEVPAPADEEIPAPADESQPTLHGEIRTGWRLLSGEHEGRFPQDVALKDGPRIFELDLVGTDPRPDASVDEMELHLSGVGDGASDYLMTLRKRGSFDVSGGYRRDSYDYVASGDPFQYDSVRERSFVHALWTPDRDSAVRATWDRNDRRGHAETFGFGTNASGVAPEAEPRSFTDESDRFSLGGDYGIGILRFGLTQTVGLTGVHEERAFDADRTTELSVRSKAFSTAGKIGASLADGELDVTLFAVRTTGPTDDRSIFHESTSTTHSFTGEVDRHAMTWRLEAAWRPWRDWEFTVAAEKFDLVDETFGDQQTMPPPDPPNPRLADGDVEHRERRASVDATWDATDELRLRLGEEVLREELYVPTDSHFGPYGEDKNPHPTDLSSNTFRTTAGADWRPSKKVSLAATAHFAVNNDPQTTAAPRDSDDWTARGRWKPSDELALTTVWRRQVFDHSGSVDLDQIRNPDSRNPPAIGSTDLDSTSRSSSVSQSVAWTQGPWSVHGTGTYRRLDTTSDSAYYNGLSVKGLENVGWSGRVVIVDVGVRYEVTQTFRVFGDAVRSNARDDMETSQSGKATHVGYPARRLDVSAGAEYDFGADVETDGGPRKNMTVGVTVSSWRLVDGESPGDSFRAYGVEFSVAYRF